MSEDRCTCTSERANDGSEYGACDFCEEMAHADRFGDRDMLNALHANEYAACPRAACRGTDIDVGPGATAYCNTCGVRW
jgi:hypothetical protein